MEACVKKKLLHVGCGTAAKPEAYRACAETRLDASAEVAPDIIASIAAMPMLADGSFDVVYCSHCLEHLPLHEAAMALAEFARVLAPGGFLDLRLPDLQGVAGRIACDEPEVVLYNSPIGPVTPLDLFYGHRQTVGQGHVLMQHRCGFTSSSLIAALKRAGFEGILVERAPLYELQAVAYRPESAGVEAVRGLKAVALAEGRGDAGGE